MVEDRSRQALGGAGIAWFVVGLLLVASKNVGGWFFFILGLSYLAGTMGPGRSLAYEHPRLLRWVIAGITVLVLSVAFVALIR